VQVPASRNAPCPCGSGRRYKECHGALSAPPPRNEALEGVLARALAAQRAGALADAAAGYEAALEIAPAHFDALHMLSVVRYQQGEFDAALPLLDRALAAQPGNAAAAFNRKLIVQALERRPIEAELARAVLPALARDVDPTWPQPSGPVHCVLATPRPDVFASELATRTVAALRALQATYWVETNPPLLDPTASASASDAARIDPRTAAFPRDGAVAFVGTARSPVLWWSRCAPECVVLVVDAFAPADLGERIEELAARACRVSLAFADASLASRVGLPGRVLEPQ
jgi:tetratricopeptide (TPR) repeat protein